ncbi:hypothetical protein N2152v2_000566 [Parachlorella kessleri]
MDVLVWVLDAISPISPDIPAVPGFVAFAAALHSVPQAWEVRPPQPSGCLPSEQLSSQWDTRFLEQQGGVPQEVAWAPSAAEAGGLLPAVLQERAAGIAQALAIARNEARQRRHGMSYDTEGLLALEVADCLGVAASQ